MKYIDRQMRLWADMVEGLITESHWPEDYIRRATNAVMQSDLAGKIQPELASGLVRRAADMFTPLMRVNRYTRLFIPSVRNAVKDSNGDPEKFKALMGERIPKLVGWFKIMKNDAEIQNAHFEEFTSGDYGYIKNVMEPREIEMSKSGDIDFKVEDKGYFIEKIDSYEQLNGEYGGDWTGAGFSKWCHTNSQDTYNQYMHNGSCRMVIVGKRDWKDVDVPEDVSKAPYDEYGMSLMALVIGLENLDLQKCTLRWNHRHEPSKIMPGREVDNAFISYAEISRVSGIDVEAYVKQHLQSDAVQWKEAVRTANRSAALAMKRKTAIDENTFTDLIRANVTHVEIPESVVEIGKGAFRNCRNLTEITVPENVGSVGANAFEGCVSLQRIEILGNVTELKDSTFRDCDRLASVVLPSSLKSIGSYVFLGDSALKKIRLPAGVESIGLDTFKFSGITQFIAPPSLEYLESHAFECVSSLKRVDLSKSKLREILDFTFSDCDFLEYVSLPEGLEAIGAGSFGGCTALERVEMPSSVETIGDSAFDGCIALQRLRIPEQLRMAGLCAFMGCDELVLEIPEFWESVERFSDVFGVYEGEDVKQITMYKV